MNTVEIALKFIVPYENNPRFNDNAVEAVAESIKEFGFQQPLVLDKDNVIIVGHTRYKAAELLGLETVPCVIADNLTEEQVRAYRLADNKVGELATWDLDLLNIELGEIEDIEMEMFGFDLDGLSFLKAMMQKWSKMITMRSFLKNQKQNLAIYTNLVPIG